MIDWMIKRLTRPLVIVSVIGLAVAGLGLLLGQGWLYCAGLIIAAPLYIFYFIPMGIIVLWVLLVAPWCPWDPPFLREETMREPSAGGDLASARRHNVGVQHAKEDRH